MKKLALILVVGLVGGVLLTGCGKENKDTTSNLSSEFSVDNTQTENAGETPKDGSQAKTNISDITIVDGSKDIAVTEKASSVSESGGSVFDPFVSLPEVNSNVELSGKYIGVEQYGDEKESLGVFRHYLKFETEGNTNGMVEIKYNDDKKMLFNDDTLIKVVGVIGVITESGIEIPVINATSVTQN